MGQKVNPISLRMGISRSNDNSWHHSSRYPEMLYQALQFQSYIKSTCKSLLFSSSRYIIQNFPKKRDIFFFYTSLDPKLGNNNFNKKPIKNKTIDTFENYLGSRGITNVSTINYRTPRHLILLFLLILSKHSKNLISFQNIPQSIIQLWSSTSKSLVKQEPKLVFEGSKMFEKGINESISIYPVKLLDTSMGAGFLAEELSFLIERKKSFKFATKQLMKKVKKNPSIRGIKMSCSGRLNGVEMARTEYKKYGQTSLQTMSTKIDYGTSEAKTAYGIIGVKVWVCYH